MNRSFFRFEKISIIALVDMKEFDDKALKLILNKIDEWLESRFGSYCISDYIELALVLHIENNNDKFLEYIKKAILQRPYFIKIPVEIVQNEKTMYISKQENLAQTWRYKK